MLITNLLDPFCAADKHSLLRLLTGDCGTPTVEDTESYALPALHSLADIPPSFNPEKACAFELATAVSEAAGVLHWCYASVVECSGPS